MKGETVGKIGETGKGRPEYQEGATGERGRQLCIRVATGALAVGLVCEPGAAKVSAMLQFRSSAAPSAGCVYLSSQRVACGRLRLLTVFSGGCPGV
jgi:hypothetical protein